MNKSENEYKNLIRDLIKYTTILLVINILMFLSDPSKNKLLGSFYIKLIIFFQLGLITYWLILDKLIYKL